MGAIDHGQVAEQPLKRIHKKLQPQNQIRTNVAKETLSKPCWKEPGRPEKHHMKFRR